MTPVPLSYMYYITLAYIFTLSNTVDGLHISDNQTTSVIINTQPIPFKFLGQNTWHKIFDWFSAGSASFFFSLPHTLNCIGSNAHYWMRMIVHWRIALSFEMLSITFHIWKILFTLSVCGPIFPKCWILAFIQYS